MNVFFCDVCGVRVTDVDLKSGHGMRRRHDVICATCLEMGHGKGWAEKAGLSARSAAVITSTVTKPADPAARLDAPRDRAATIENVEPAVVVAPVRMRTPAPSIVVEEPRAQDLGAAAASFGALTSTPAPAVALEDIPDSAPLPAKAETEPGLDVEDIPAATGGRRSSSGRHKPSSGKVEKPGSGKTPKPDRSATSRRKGTADSDTPESSNSDKESGKKSTGSTKRSKVSKGARKPGGIPPVVMITMAGVLLIVIAGMGTMASTGVFSSSKSSASFDPKASRDRLTLAVKDAKTAAYRDAHGATDAQVDEALTKIRAMQAAMSQFESSVKGQWSDTQVGAQLQDLGYADVMGKLKMWNDERAKRSQRPK